MKLKNTQPAANRTIQANARGSSAVEFSLVAPVLFYLVLITFDLGLHIVAMIAVENAARAAAARNSSGLESATDQETACAMAMAELKGLPSVPTSGTCAGAPVEVKSVLCDDSEPCYGAVGSADGGQAAAVTVKYTLPALFTLPVVGPAAITRTCQMRIRSLT